jgi:hypothetical protein
MVNLNGLLGILVFCSVITVEQFCLFGKKRVHSNMLHSHENPASLVFMVLYLLPNWKLDSIVQP